MSNARQGLSGTTIVAGEITGEEYLTEFETIANRVLTYNKMKNDGQVIGTFEAIRKPIITSNFDIQFPKRVRESKGFNEAQAEKKLDVMREALFEMPGCSFNYIIETLLWGVAYGFRYMEMVYVDDADRTFVRNFRDGKQRLSWFRWEDRVPAVHTKWLLNKNNQMLEGVEQFAPSADDSARMETKQIPRNRMVLLIHGQEGNDYNGTGMWRACYRPWFINYKLHTIEAVGAERFGAGIPIFKPPENIAVGSPEWVKAEQTAKGLASHEKSFLIVPHGWEVDMLTMSGKNSLAEVRAIIDKNDAEISRRQLLHILESGREEKGSRNVASLQQAMFEGGLGAFADEVCDAITRDAIEFLWKKYWPGDVFFPRLTHDKIQVRNLDRMAVTIKTLAESGALEVDADLENWVRELGNMPPKMEVEEEAPPKPPAAPETEPEELDKNEPKKEEEVETPETKVKPGGKEGSLRAAKGFPVSDEARKVYGIRRNPTEFEGKVIDFDFMATTDKRGTENIVRHFEELLPLLIVKLAESKDPLTADVQAVQKQMTDSLYGEMLDAERAGEQSIEKEMEAQGFSPEKTAAKSKITGQYTTSRSALKKLMRERADLEISMLVQKYKVSAKTSVLRGMELDKSLTEIAAIVIDDLTSLSEASIVRAAKESFRKAFGYGRNKKNEMFADEHGLKRWVYSAIFDLLICEECVPFDKMEHGGEIPAPNPNCLGGGLCRCENIPIWEEVPGHRTKSLAQLMRHPADIPVVGTEER